MLVSILIFHKQIGELAGGFGSIKLEGLKTAELYNTQWYQYFFGVHILGVLCLFGLYSFIKDFNEKRCLFLGLFVASVYLVFSASRYIYFSSVVIVTLAALFLDNRKIIRKRFDMFVILSISVFLIVLIYSLYAVPLYFAQSRYIPNAEPFLFLKDNSPSNACVVHTGEIGAAIEYFAKRYFYLHSLGNHVDRENKVSLLLMDNSTKYVDEEITHIFLYYQDLTKMNIFNNKANLSEIGFFRIAATREDETENESRIVEELSFMQTVHINRKTFINESGIGCYYQYKGDEFYMKRGVCNTNLFKMITNQSIRGFRSVYFKDGYSIYEVLPESS